MTTHRRDVLLRTNSGIRFSRRMDRRRPGSRRGVPHCASIASDSNPDAPHQVYGAGSGIPFYGGRRTRYFYIVTNRLDRGQTAEGFWETSRMPPGNYVLRGWAADVSGNMVERDLPVTIGAGNGHDTR